MGKAKEEKSQDSWEKKNYWKYGRTDYKLWPTVCGIDHRRYDTKSHELQKTPC